MWRLRSINTQWKNAVESLEWNPGDKLPPKRVRRPTRGMTTDILCEATRDSNMICPITCGCHNSLRGIGEKTRIVSQILRSTRLIRKNELIAVFGLTAAITNKPEILALKQAQEKRNSNLYRTSIQYTILGNIHGKEMYLVPPQDAALLLQDRISPGLRKQLKQHNTIDDLPPKWSIPKKKMAPRASVEGNPRSGAKLLNI